MKANDKLLERINNIQEQLKKIQNIDMDNLIDLKNAKESIRVIKNDLTDMLEESPLYASVMNFVCKVMNYDVIKDIEHWENVISEKINVVLKRATDIVKEKTPECSSCTCSCKECDPDYFDDEDLEIDTTLEAEPITGQELLDDFIDDDLFEDVKDKDTYANLIAGYLNKHHDYLDRVNDDDQIDYLSNILFEFVNYTMSR